MSPNAGQPVLKRIRFWIAIVMAGLVASGVTAFPLQSEVHWLVSVLCTTFCRPFAEQTGLLPWLEVVANGLAETNARNPFLAYGTDWLAFAHLMIAILFIGPFIDPLRNKWCIDWGLLACAGVFVLALTAGSCRGIPLGWRLVDCSFGIMAAGPLLLCRKLIADRERLEVH